MRYRGSSQLPGRVQHCHEWSIADMGDCEGLQPPLCSPFLKLWVVRGRRVQYLAILIASFITISWENYNLVTSV